MTRSSIRETIEHGIGVAEQHAYSVKVDSDYFEEA
jgi:hypothetical protein